MVITVTCPSCASSFPVDPAKIPEGGVNARCTRCSDIFRVEKPAEPVMELSDLTPVDQAPPSIPEVPSVPAPVEEERDAEPEPEATPAFDEPATFEAPSSFEAPSTFEAPPSFETPSTFEAPASFEAPPPLPDPEPPPREPMPDFSMPDSGSDPFAEPAPFEGAAPVGPSHTPFGGGPAEDEEQERAVQGFTFGKRDPTDKAKRLARVLVSDMIMYNAERHQAALGAGTLAQDFEEEIQKSWKEYVEQVGDDMANGEGRRFWVDALNDILAKGKDVF
jgi:predicted Zn finger-like uncharacterized protein